MSSPSSIELSISEAVGILKAIDLVIRILDEEEPLDGRLLILNDVWNLLIDRLELS